MQTKDWRRVRRVLVVRTDEPDDVLLLGPALRALKGALPRAEVDLLTSPPGAAAARLLPWVDRVHTAGFAWENAGGGSGGDAGGRVPGGPDEPPADPDAGTTVSVHSQVELIETLERGRYDAALVFTRPGRSPLPAAHLAWFAGIPLRLAQATEDGGGLLTTTVPPLDGAAHLVDRNLHLLEATGLPVAGRQLAVAVPPAADATAAAHLRSLRIPPGEPFALLAPGGPPSRRYPPARYALACQALHERTGLPVVVAGAREAVAVGAAVVAAARGAAVGSVAGQTTLAEFAALVARADVVITNHGLPMHLADALRRPQVVLFGGTEPEARWRPRASPCALLRQPTRCSPCHRPTCPYDLDCLDVPPAVVANAAAALAGRAPAATPAATAPVPVPPGPAAPRRPLPAAARGPHAAAVPHVPHARDPIGGTQ